MELQTHQQRALRLLSDGKILWGGVGSGKSRVAVAYYEKEHKDKDVYVITTAKKRDSLDWQGEFASIAVGRDTEDRICSEEWVDLVPDSAHGLLKVDSWNNLQKYTDVKDAFFIFDEQRLVGSGTWVKSFLRIAKSNKWIMLSATPGDTWLDYIPVFVANGFYKNRTQFKTEHVVYAPFTKFPKVARYLNEGRLNKLRESILVHMPHPKLTTRRSINMTVEYNEELFASVAKNRWHIYQNRPIKDIAELVGVLRRVVNSDPSRVKTIESLLEKHPKMVVFYNFNYELEALKRLQSVTAVSEWNGWRHEEIPKASTWLYLVQYVAGAEGWNCVETDTIAFHSMTYSYKLWEQAYGRIDRLNTPFLDLYYYVLRSKSMIDKAIWRSLAAKKNFNAASFPVETISLAKSERFLKEASERGV